MSIGAFKQKTIALVYDFDGTLTPESMQEYTILPELGIDPKDFWKKVKKESTQNEGDQIITYMRLLVEYAKSPDYRTRISKESLKKLGSRVKFFDGVTSYFKRINKFVEKESQGKVKLKHYLISAGQEEIIQGTKIKNEFSNIFASKYHYNEDGAPVFPEIIVNDTAKTQYLFRINKGIEDITKHVNDFMPIEKRPIPFNNILYIGDGMTDVPCMTVTTKNGGFAIAVYNEEKKKNLKTCKKLWENHRVHYIAPADYRRNGKLDIAIKTILRFMIHLILFNEYAVNEYAQITTKLKGLGNES